MRKQIRYKTDSDNTSEQPRVRGGASSDRVI